MGSGALVTRMAVGCGPAAGAAGSVLCTAARKLANAVGAGARAISVGLVSVGPLCTSRPGTLMIPPSADGSAAPGRGCGPAENCALRDPSGAGAGAFTFGSRPTIATLTAAPVSGNAG